MLRLLARVLLLQAFLAVSVHAAAENLQLVVSEPYLEMHSGPGRGYPVIYVIGRDEVVTVLYSAHRAARRAGHGVRNSPSPSSLRGNRRRFPRIRTSRRIAGRSAPATASTTARTW
jgi:hypothetical protein